MSSLIRCNKYFLEWSWTLQLCHMKLYLVLHLRLCCPFFFLPTRNLVPHMIYSFLSVPQKHIWHGARRAWQLFVTFNWWKEEISESHLQWTYRRNMNAHLSRAWTAPCGNHIPRSENETTHIWGFLTGSSCYFLPRLFPGMSTDVISMKLSELQNIWQCFVTLWMAWRPTQTELLPSY